MTEASRAKCATEIYRIEGRVIDKVSGAAVLGADVSFDWNTMNSKASARSVMDLEGRFAVDLRFYPWSGEDDGRDLCAAALETVDVTIVAPGYKKYMTNLRIHTKMTTKTFELLKRD